MAVERGEIGRRRRIRRTGSLVTERETLSEIPEMIQLLDRLAFYSLEEGVVEPA